MRFLEQQAAVGAAIILLATVSEARHVHNRPVQLETLDRRHGHGHGHSHNKIHSSRAEHEDEPALDKRDICSFPLTAGLVAVTPGQKNAGWAMSPDQPCVAGKFCPYACPPGQLMGQWDSEATTYSYPASMNGGLKCDSGGQIKKPFPNKPYCYKGTGSVFAANECSKNVAYCQTVLPGNEAMLIPTNVGSGQTVELAVPDTDYWAGTAAHYYINPPGVSTEEACVWGDGSKPVGNWSPYVAGANTDASGETFVKIAWNPIYTGESDFQNDLPKFGVRVTCKGGGCNGLPCSIDPAEVKVNGVTSGNSASGAGGGNFCVVTVPKGSKASIETFDVGGSSGGGGGGGGGDETTEPSSSPEPTPEPTPTPTPTPTPEPTPTPTPKSSSSSSEDSSSEDSTSSSSSSSTSESSKSSKSSSSSSSTTSEETSSEDTTSASAHPTVLPQLLFENDTALYNNSPTGMSSAVKPGATNTSTSDSPSGNPSVAASITLQSSFVALAAAFAACSMLL